LLLTLLASHGSADDARARQQLHMVCFPAHPLTRGAAFKSKLESQSITKGTALTDADADDRFYQMSFCTHVASGIP
jgi:hypothetical protein